MTNFDSLQQNPNFIDFVARLEFVPEDQAKEKFLEFVSDMPRRKNELSKEESLSRIETMEMICWNTLASLCNKYYSVKNDVIELIELNYQIESFANPSYFFKEYYWTASGLEPTKLEFYLTVANKMFSVFKGLRLAIIGDIRNFYKDAKNKT